jgi:hypothetical protein
MINAYYAYMVGKGLALHKFAEETGTEVTELTDALDEMLDSRPAGVSTNVLDSSERPGSATWGDKMELETPKNTGINV